MKPFNLNAYLRHLNTLSGYERPEFKNANFFNLYGKPEILYSNILNKNPINAQENRVPSPGKLKVDEP